MIPTQNTSQRYKHIKEQLKIRVIEWDRIRISREHSREWGREILKDKKGQEYSVIVRR